MDLEQPSPRAPSPAIVQLRAVATVAAAAAAAYGLYSFQVTGLGTTGWWMLALAIVLSAVVQPGVRFPAPEPGPPPAPASTLRRVLGALVAAAGAALWVLATYRLYSNWQAGFDFAWLGWGGAVILLGGGLDLAWGRWPRPAARRWRWPMLGLMLGLIAVAGWYRLGNIRDFPGEAAITQIEDLQVGNFGAAYLNGYRLRWEYLSSTWLAALGLWLGGPSQFAERVPFAVVSTLKLLPLFVWLRLTVGTAGAVVGSSLLAFSFWDVVLSRIPNNHNALVVSIVFALLAGPVRRGRPSAYVWLGFFGGYVLHEYVAYRPLAVLAVAGALLWSLRDRCAGWPARTLRPLLTIVLLVSMVTPLFVTRIPGHMRVEYFDGWNRARGIVGYYNSNDTWGQALQRRYARAYDAAELFTVRGDRSPVRNIPGQPPLVDPVTCALLVLGIGTAAANLLRPVFGLTLLGLLVTVTGTLIMTGNFDVARVGGAVPYVYALAGFGAAAVLTAVSQAWGRVGRGLMLGLLAAAVAGAGVWSTRHLLELWSNPNIRRAHRNNLAYLTVWLRDHQQPGERVVGIAPGYANVLEMHDGGWLRGREIPGFVTWDVETALRQWEREPGPTLLFVYAGPSTEPMRRFLESLFPGLQFQLDVDPLAASADVAYARLPGPPPELAQRLADWRCRGVHTEFAILGANAQVLYRNDSVQPFVCNSTWPAAVPETLHRVVQPQKITARYSTGFLIGAPGAYQFNLMIYAGAGSLLIDGQRRDSSATAIQLGAGLHQLEATAEFAPMAMEPLIRLMWSGPETGGRQQLMPLYKLAPLDPSCAAAGQAQVAGGQPAAGRRYITEWIGRGPFDGSNATVREDFIDVVPLSSAPAAASGWAPIQTRDAFVDLARVYAAGRQPSASPRWVCGYVATTISSPAARPAFLELAGSGDPVRAWLNGRELTSGPLTAGYEPSRRAIGLQAGPNLLVIESCDLLGAWYFIAALTDADGRELADLRYTAALPEQPIALPPPDTGPDVQLIDGFGDLVGAPHTQALYGDYRGGTGSWWAYVQDEEPEVAWRTTPAAERKRTVVALTASTSPEDGQAELVVNGRSVLTFPIGTQGVGGTWEADGYQAAFISRGFFDGNSGIFVVSVPADDITPGAPIDLRVRLTQGQPRTWFMIKGYRDTVAFEKLDGPELQGKLHGLWETRAAAKAQGSLPNPPE